MICLRDNHNSLSQFLAAQFQGNGSNLFEGRGCSECDLHISDEEGYHYLPTSEMASREYKPPSWFLASQRVCYPSFQEWYALSSEEKREYEEFESGHRNDVVKEYYDPVESDDSESYSAKRKDKEKPADRAQMIANSFPMGGMFNKWSPDSCSNVPKVSRNNQLPDKKDTKDAWDL